MTTRCNRFDKSKKNRRWFELKRVSVRNVRCPHCLRAWRYHTWTMLGSPIEKHRRKKKKKLERRVGKTREKGYNDGVNEGWRGITEARETLVDRRSGWRGREWGSGRERKRERVGCALATSPDDPEHTIYQSVLSIIRVYSCRPRINLVPLLFASVKFSRSPAVVLN